MHNELNEKNINEIIENPLQNQLNNLSLEFYKCVFIFDKRNKSIISDTFYFPEIFTNECKNCKKISYNFSFNNNITISLDDVLNDKKKNNANNECIENLNIKDCFNYLTMKKNNNNFCCPNCQIRNKSSSIYKINSPSEILTIILNQNNIQNGGIDFSLDFEIDLENYLFNWGSNNNSKVEYELIGMLTYLKENNGFNRNAFFKNKDKGWYSYNESEIKAVPDIHTYLGIPYLLFYQKKK